MISDTRGNLVSYKKEIPDSVKIESVEKEEARTLVYNFMKEFSPVSVNDSIKVKNEFAVKGTFDEQEVQTTIKQSRTDYKFSWIGKSGDIQKDIIVSAVVSGNTVSDFNVQYEVPEEVVTDTSSTFSLSTVIPFYIYSICFNNHYRL